jgi:hypothetical protein
MIHPVLPQMSGERREFDRKTRLIASWPTLKTLLPGINSHSRPPLDPQIISDLDRLFIEYESMDASETLQDIGRKWKFVNQWTGENNSPAEFKRQIEEIFRVLKEQRAYMRLEPESSPRKDPARPEGTKDSRAVEYLENIEQFTTMWEVYSKMERFDTGSAFPNLAFSFGLIRVPPRTPQTKESNKWMELIGRITGTIDQMENWYIAQQLVTGMAGDIGVLILERGTWT